MDRDGQLRRAHLYIERKLGKVMTYPVYDLGPQYTPRWSFLVLDLDDTIAKADPSFGPPKHYDYSFRNGKITEYTVDTESQFQ